jgi:hypothetical protein
MKLFKCQSCHQPIYFENRVCGNCGHKLGYLPVKGQLTALAPAGDVFTALVDKRQRVRYCANIADDACNWLIPADAPDEYCLACRHNRTIPDITVPENLARWQKMEIAKHRLFYTLIALRLPLHDLTEDPEHGLAFDFLADNPAAETQVLTGHDAGLITINLSEADDATREKLRTAMGEPYRTLLGHFRHEVGHHFWDILVRDAGRLEECRAVFGDDSADYGEALKRHYAEGPPADWQESFISAYATAHPWEDFAETWAHYLHIVDTLETASAFGLRIHPAEAKTKALHADLDFDPHQALSIEKLIDGWLPLTFAVNSLNRSMGHADLYPFIVSPPVVRKLKFIHDVIRAGAVVQKAAAPTKRSLLSRMMRTAAPEQPPAPAPEPPAPVPPPEPPAPDLPDQKPPMVEPPSDKPLPTPPPPDDAPPPVVPPGGPVELPPPGNQPETPMRMGIG